MISHKLKDYLISYILLKDDELNLLYIQEQDGIIEIPIVKKTSKTRRVVARLTVGTTSSSEEHLPDKLSKQFQSPKSSRKMELTTETYEWIRAGGVIKELRFEKDERTVKRVLQIRLWGLDLKTGGDYLTLTCLDSKAYSG